MKKIIIFLILGAGVTVLYFCLEKWKDFFKEETILVPYVMDSKTPLECSQCNPKSGISALCVNCKFKGKIELLSHDIIIGRIMKIEGSKVTIKVKYGVVEVDKEQIVNEPLRIKAGSYPNNEIKPEINKKTEGPHTLSETDQTKTVLPIENKTSSMPLFSKTTPKNIKDIFKEYKWIAYSPSEYSPGQEAKLTVESIVKDLELLRSCGFNALLTYTSVKILSEIPLLARQNGFDAVIMGVWDPDNPIEIENAIKKKDYADGYCIGNEGLHFKRYNPEVVEQRMKEIRQATGRPVTTSEPLDIIMNSQYHSMLKECDFLFVIAHFFFDSNLNSKNPKDGVKWVKSMFSEIKSRLGFKKPIIFKEVGYPTGGEGWADEKRQSEFFSLIERIKIPFCYFEAFDQPWKIDLEVEPFWGLFKNDRTPKEYAAQRIKNLK